MMCGLAESVLIIPRLRTDERKAVPPIAAQLASPKNSLLLYSFLLILPFSYKLSMDEVLWT